MSVDTSLLNLTRKTFAQLSPTDSVEVGNAATKTDFRAYVQDILLIALQGGVTPPWPPQGRLTLTSGSPVMTSDVTAATSIYYDAYTGQWVPINLGSGIFFPFSIGSGLTFALNTSNHLSGKLYDLFIFNNGSISSPSIILAAGPAWTNSTTRSAAITQVSGIWCNNALITLTNGSTTYSNVAANQATYVGTFYATANGQTAMQFKPAAAAGGTPAILGLYNAYNRVRSVAIERDSSTWTYNSTSWRQADNSGNNYIRFVDGLGQSFGEALYQNRVTPTANTDVGSIGISYDVIATPESVATAFGNSSAIMAETLTASDTFYPSIGTHTINPVEQYGNNGSGTSVAFGSSSSQAYLLKLSIEI